jgi:mannosyl-oligosaccharide alpha-1,2-mannosidase
MSFPLQAWSQPWSGLVGSKVNIKTGLFEDAHGGWNGGEDSFYEYLIKVKFSNAGAPICH